MASGKNPKSPPATITSSRVRNFSTTPRPTRPKSLLASDFGLVGRGVVLKFLTRLEVIVAGGDFGFLPDAMTPAEGGQCRIGHLGSTAHQFFMDSNQIAFEPRCPIRH